MNCRRLPVVFAVVILSALVSGCARDTPDCTREAVRQSLVSKLADPFAYPTVLNDEALRSVLSKAVVQIDDTARIGQDGVEHASVCRATVVFRSGPGSAQTFNERMSVVYEARFITGDKIVGVTVDLLPVGRRMISQGRLKP